MSRSAATGVPARWVKLAPGATLQVLCELRLGEGGTLEFVNVSECAAGFNYATWVESDDAPDGGVWFEIEWREELGGYAYDAEAALT